MRKKTYSLYRKFFVYFKPYWKRFTLALICMALSAAISALLIWFIKWMVDAVLIKKNLEFLNLAPLFIVGIFLFQGLFNYGERHLMNWIGQRVIFDIRNRLYEHIQKLSLDFFSHHPVGELISRITNDVALMQNAFSKALGNLIKEGLTVVALSVTIFFLNWKLALISLIIFPFLIHFATGLGKKLRKIARQARQRMAILTSVLEETFSGIRIVKAFSMEGYEGKKFRSRNEDFFRAEMRSRRISSMISPLIGFISSFGIAFIVWYGGREVIRGPFTTGGFVAFLGALLSLYRPFSKLGEINAVIQQAMASGERVLEMLDISPRIANVSHPVKIEEFRERIVFENVSFKYDEELVLKNVNLEIRKGEKVALVGPSGAGKTTLVNLVARFYDPTEGRIFLDGVDLRKIEVSSLRKLLGIVTQETILFNDTIKNNIAYGRPEATFEEIVEAAKKANAHEFIERMEKGYETSVEEKGGRLSGGEQQRIAIARALLKNPSILILDEATSELDSESEALLQKALKELLKNRTALIIAHRLSTVREADKIVVLEEGEIKEIGNHKELLKKGGLYTRLYRLQFQETSPDEKIRT